MLITATFSFQGVVTDEQMRNINDAIKATDLSLVRAGRKRSRQEGKKESNEHD